MGDSLIVCNRPGETPLAVELENAVIDSMSWTLAPFTDANRLSFEMPATDPKYGEIVLWDREIQFWRDGVCRWPGVIAAKHGGSKGGKARFECLGLEEYYHHRYTGPTPSLPGFGYPTTTAGDVSSNPDFPNGLAGWSATAGVTMTESNETRAQGTNSMKLVYGTDGQDSYAEFTFDVTNGGAGVAAGYVTYYVPAWFYILVLTGTAWQERGLYAQCQYPFGTLYDEQWAPITMAAPTAPLAAGQRWFPLETFVKSPTGPSPITSRIKIRLYAIHGTIFWDGVNVFQQRSVGSNGGEIIDYATIIGRLHDYLTGATTEAQDLGKTDLGIGRSLATTGVTEDRAYDLADNAKGADLLADVVKRNLCDLAVLSDGTTRTLTGWAPRRGSFKPAYLFECDNDGTGNIVDFSDDEDGLGVSNAPRVVGRGTGPSRQVTEVTDTTGLGGLRLESVETASSDSIESDLYPRAAELLRISKTAPKVPSVTINEGASGTYLGALEPGDTVPVSLIWGGINDVATRRIAKIELRPRVNTLTYTFNDA